MKLVLAMMLMAGCGVVVPSGPATSEVSEVGSALPICGEMSCSVVACFAASGGDRPRCYCGLSSDPAYQSDKPMVCACWERLPDDFSGETGCVYQ